LIEQRDNLIDTIQVLESKVFQELIFESHGVRLLMCILLSLLTPNKWIEFGGRADLLRRRIHCHIPLARSWRCSRQQDDLRVISCRIYGSDWLFAELYRSLPSALPDVELEMKLPPPIELVVLNILTNFDEQDAQLVERRKQLMTWLSRQKILPNAPEDFTKSAWHFT
jgi:hypothetical protein